MKTTFLHKALLALAALAAAALTSCDSDVFNVNADPFKGSSYVSGLDDPISDYIDSDETLTEFAKALRYSGLYNAINQCNQGVTFSVFAPDNDAMADFYARRGVKSLEELTPEYVRSFVLYHTKGDSIAGDKFISATSVTNLLDEILPVSIDAEAAGHASIGDLGHVYQMGIHASNGTVFILSRAMTPLVETVVDRIAESGASIMAQAVEAAGYKNDLNIVADTTVELGYTMISKRLYTFLNVSDAAFAKAGINSLADLRSRLAADDDQGLTPDSLLRRYVAYHIINSSYTLAEFAGTDTVASTRLFSTLAEKQVIQLDVDGTVTDYAGRMVFNSKGVPARFDVAASDIKSTNGYIHTLDSYLPVYEPDQTEVIWDLCEYAAIKAAIGASYQPAEAVSSESLFTVNNAFANQYEPSLSGTANRNMSSITYITSAVFASGRGANRVELYCRNNDRLALNLGFTGSICFKTPTLVRGKYKVNICVVRTSSLEFITNKGGGSNGGCIKVVMDDREDELVYAYPYLYYTTLNGPLETTLIDEIEFDLTASHDFNITIMDPAATSNGGFSFQIDYVRFIPITDGAE